MTTQLVKSGKIIISWTVWYVDISVEEYYSIDFISNPKQNVKTYQRYLYIDYDDLSAKDKIFVDIAKERQKYFDDPSYFFQLRHLFIDGNRTNLKNATSVSSVMSLGYYEDLLGNMITEKQFLEMQKNLRNIRKTYSGIWVPETLSEDAAYSLKLYDCIKLTDDKIILSDEHIDILNRFINDVICVANSSLRTQHNAIILNDSLYKGKTISRNISDEQYNASLLAFRKLYMEREPACFYKAIKILENKCFIKHPIIELISQIKTQYTKLLKSPITDLEYSGNFIKSSLEGEWCPSGKNLIDMTLYTGIIHQGDEKHLCLEKQILDVLPNKDLLIWIFYDLFLKTVNCMIEAANIAIKVLTTINKLDFHIPPRNKDNKAEEFEKFILEKSFELAELIWAENGRSPEGVVKYIADAKKEIFTKFSTLDIQ